MLHRRGINGTDTLSRLCAASKSRLCAAPPSRGPYHEAPVGNARTAFEGGKLVGCIEKLDILALFAKRGGNDSLVLHGVDGARGVHQAAAALESLDAALEDATLQRVKAVDNEEEEIKSGNSHDNEVDENRGQEQEARARATSWVCKAAVRSGSDQATYPMAS